MAKKNHSGISGFDKLSIVGFNIAGIPAIATSVKEMTCALDQFVDIVLKVYKATIMALDLLESESVTKSEECTEAILSITEVTELAYQFIDKIDYLNYHFQTLQFKCEVKKMTSKEHLQRLQNTLRKTTKAMSDAEEIYTNLKDKCRKVAKDCSKAEQFCRNKANTARRDSNITKGVGGAAAGTAIALGTTGAVATAVTTVGVGISIFAGFATFGIGTLVGLGITGAVVGTVSVVGIAAGAGGAVVTHVVASNFIKAEKTFKKFTQQFEDLSRYAIKVHSFTENVSTSLKRTLTFIEEIQLYDYDCHDMSRCQDELLRLHQVAIDMHRKTSSIKYQLQREKSKLAEKIPKLFLAD